MAEEQLCLDSKVTLVLALESPIDMTLELEGSDLERELDMSSLSTLEYFE